jgi:hypothetical protein
MLEGSLHLAAPFVHTFTAERVAQRLAGAEVRVVLRLVEDRLHRFVQLVSPRFRRQGAKVGKQLLHIDARK